MGNLRYHVGYPDYSKENERSNNAPNDEEVFASFVSVNESMMEYLSHFPRACEIKSEKAKWQRPSVRKKKAPEAFAMANKSRFFTES